MVEIPITILNSELVEQYKNNGQIIYPYVSFSPHSVTGTPTQACPASYKTHPVNTVKVDNDNFQYEVEIPRGLAPFQVKTIWLFDQEDQLIGYATVDIPYLGSAKLSVRLLVNYTGWPGADPWENMNQMVQNEVNILESWKANAENIDTGIPRLWNRTIYVDQQNGDDENPGTQDAPVASLKHAIEDLVPVGGKGRVILLSDYVLENDIVIDHKVIVLEVSGVLSTQYYNYSQTLKALRAFYMINSFMNILLDNGVINIPDTEDDVYTPFVGLFLIQSPESTRNIVEIWSSNGKINALAPLVKIQKWRAVPSVFIFSYRETNVEGEIIVKSFLIEGDYVNFILGYRNFGTLKRPDGSDIEDLLQVISPIRYDENGQIVNILRYIT